jgi:RNA-directed DNA polymerase
VKRKKHPCFAFDVNLGTNLARLHEELHSGTYRPAPYRKFMVYEPKERIIYAPAYRDIVVQHAIYRVICPIFDRTFIDTSFACRKGMGTHKACIYTQGALRACPDDSYTLKLDIRKFFYSIDRGVLKKQIERKIKDCRFVDVMMMFAQMETPVGIPIGNLLSQIYALIYMDPVDHFIKRVLKIKHYVRYVDDFILVGITRDQCLVFREKIICFLKEILAIELSKSTIQKVKKGLNFVGYRTWKNKKFIRKYSLYKFKRMVKKNNQEAVVSILGHAKYTNSLPYMLNILKETKNDIKIPKNYRRLYYTHAYRA